MEIIILSSGKVNDSFIEQGIQYYFKKIKHYCSINLQIFQPKKTANSIDQIKAIEEEEYLKKISNLDYVILLDEKGKKFTNPAFASQWQQILNQSPKRIVIIIGGAYGVSESIKKRAQLTWSFSDMVFPHQLMRLMVSEQIYRTYSILNNLPYHHE